MSPDGKRIVYSSTAGAADQFNHLYVLPVEGGQPYKLTFGDYDDFHPRWSPDGEWIAYIINEGGMPELCLLDTHGGAKRASPSKSGTGSAPWAKSASRDRTARPDTPTAARISGAASDGKLYAPPEAYVFNARMAGGSQGIFFAEGYYDVEVPAGHAAPSKLTKASTIGPPSPGSSQVEAGPDTRCDAARSSRMST